MPTTQKNGKRIAVIGGSISGLFCALVLRNRGWAVDVYERSPEPLQGRGAGIIIQPDVALAMRAAGLDDVSDLRTIGVGIEKRVLLAPDGGRLMKMHCPQISASWERIYGLLARRFGRAAYHHGRELKSIDFAGSLPAARFADGSGVTADLIVGADGVRSSVREQLFPQAKLEYAGYVAWRSLIDEVRFPANVHRDIFPFMAFGLPAGEQFISYPVTGPGDSMTAGSLRANIVWYRPADEEAELPRLLTDTTGHVHTTSIPPPLIRPSVRAELHEAARRLAPQFQATLQIASEPFLQPIFDLESSRLAAGRVAIIGDAAFVARPHLGAGVIKAVDDAVSLANALDAESSIEAACRRYEEERLAVGRRIISRARELGENYQPSSPLAPRKSSDDTMFARSVLTQTALTAFLNG